MTLTNDTIARIQAFRKERGLNQTDLGKMVGLERSTVSKILKGEITTLRPKTIEAFLDNGLDLRPVKSGDSVVSATAAELSDLARDNPDLAAGLEFIKRLAAPSRTPFMPDVATSKLQKVGAAVTTIVHRWEQHSDPHYAKIGAEVLDWIRDYYRKGCP